MECMRRIVQCLAEQPVIRLFQQLVKVREIRRTVVATLAALQKRVDSLKIGRGYKASPCGRRVRQPGHHDCPEYRLQADVVHTVVTQDAQSVQRLITQVGEWRYHSQFRPCKLVPSLLGRCKQKQRGLRGLLCRWPSITE